MFYFVPFSVAILDLCLVDVRRYFLERECVSNLLSFRLLHVVEDDFYGWLCGSSFHPIYPQLSHSHFLVWKTLSRNHPSINLVSFSVEFFHHRLVFSSFYLLRRSKFILFYRPTFARKKNSFDTSIATCISRSFAELTFLFNSEWWWNENYFL